MFKISWIDIRYETTLLIFNTKIHAKWIDLKDFVDQKKYGHENFIAC